MATRGESRRTKRGRGRPRLPPEVWQEREKAVLEKRNEGLVNEEIASTLGITKTLVIYIVRRLIKNGRCASRQNEGPSIYRPDTTRGQLVIRMRKDGMTLREIGMRLGITYERVQQIIKKMSSRYGEELFKPDKPRFTIRNASVALGIPVNTLTHLCRRNELPHCRLGKGRLFLTEESLNALIAHPHFAYEQRTCAVCGALFETRVKSAQRCCGTQCYSRFRYRNSGKSSLTGWRRMAQERIAGHTVPENETWLAFSAAHHRAGISKMQLDWLALHRAVTVRPHPTKRAHRNGRPMRLFAASEMDLIRETRNAERRT